MVKYYRVSEAANIVGISASTLRRFDREGRVVSYRSSSGQRLFTLESLRDLLPVNDEITGNVVFYTRASDGDKDKLRGQLDLLTGQYGEPVKLYSDKASGLNENRKGLLSLLKDAKQGKITTVCITQKDRLTRFGFSYLEQLLNEYGVKIEVLGTGKTLTIHEELLQDFMSLLSSFSGKYYRLRGHEQNKKFLGMVRDKTHE